MKFEAECGAKILFNLVKVSFCDGPFSGVHCPSVRVCVNNFFKQLLL